MTTSCKHRRTWVIAGGYHEWCYECGAIRGLHVSATGSSVWPRTYWERPVGAGGENPAVRHGCMRELPHKAEQVAA